MRKIGKVVTIFLLLINLLPTQIFGRELVAVGQVVGLELQDGTVTVAAFDEELGQAAKASGLEVGDKILTMNGRSIRSAADIRSALESSRGTITMVISRQDRHLTCQITPSITADGPKLGLYLRQGITGIGTVTWYDTADGTFGTLGHGVNGADGKLLRLVSGNAYEAGVMTVRRGKAGEPGQLMGYTISRDAIGTIAKNTAQGVFGSSAVPFGGRTMQTATWEQIRTGPATILSTVSGTAVEEYGVEILKIYPRSTQTGRNLLIRVTDPELINATGGIVQGMSGSPLVQDGKLIGAVTHVLVNDPTMGYGIFIENMLEAAG